MTFINVHTQPFKNVHRCIYRTIELSNVYSCKQVHAKTTFTIFTNYSAFSNLYAAGFLGREPNADITVPFVPVTVVVRGGLLAVAG